MGNWNSTFDHTNSFLLSFDTQNRGFEFIDTAKLKVFNKEETHLVTTTQFTKRHHAEILEFGSFLIIYNQFVTNDGEYKIWFTYVDDMTCGNEKLFVKVSLKCPGSG